MVTPGPALPIFGSLLETTANRSPRGSHEKSVTVSGAEECEFSDLRIIKKSNNSKSWREFLHISPTSQNLGHKMHTFELHNFHREILFTNAENLQVAEDRLFGLRMTVYPNAEEIALILPI